MIVVQRIEIVVGKASNKKRLDEFLFAEFSGLSKMYLRDAVKTEKCEVNGRLENVGYRLKYNDFIEIELDLARQTAMWPQDIPLDVVYEDNDIIVVNKAAGMLVHPTNRDKTGTLLNALSFYLNHRSPNGEPIRPGLVHRLDMQTSGLIVVSKNQRAHKKLMEWFRRKFVEKRYTALVEGIVADDEGVIEAPIGRFGDLKCWDVKEDGKESETRFWVKKRNADTTLLELEPVTGRTNQLRIHCAHTGHPIVGDNQRGGREFERLCLHASRIGFRHPVNRDEIELESQYPAVFDLA